MDLKFIVFKYTYFHTLSDVLALHTTELQLFNQFLDVPSLLVVKGLGTKPPSSAISMYLLRLQSRLRMRILVFRAFFQKKRTRRLSVCAHRQMFFFVEMGKRLNNVGKRNLCEKRNFVREKKRAK